MESFLVVGGGGVGVGGGGGGGLYFRLFCI